MLQPDSAHVDVRGLDVAMNEAACVSLVERIAHLAKEVDHTIRGQGAVGRNHGLQVHAVEQFHDEVESLIGVTPKS